MVEHQQLKLKSNYSGVGFEIPLILLAFRIALWQSREHFGKPDLSLSKGSVHACRRMNRTVQIAHSSTMLTMSGFER